MIESSAFNHPYDTPFTSGLRFLVEIIAWVAGPWAASQWAGWLIAPALIILIGLPSLFSTSGDKRQVIVATPGPLRVVIELFLHGAAVAASWLVWPAWLAIVSTIIVAAALVAGLPRIGWLLRGAPENPRNQENPEQNV